MNKKLLKVEKHGSGVMWFAIVSFAHVVGSQ